MNYLLVVAHPDDEVLGAGGTVHKLTSAGHTVSVCVMSMAAGARTKRPSDDVLHADATSAMELLGVGTIIEGDFPNIEMNTVSHLKLVQFVEGAIRATSPDVVITHHPNDTNNDHCQTSVAVQAAVRLFQRNPAIKPLLELWFMEVLSSTEWALNSSAGAFRPNVFIGIGEEGLSMKLRTLAMYRDVMRPYPHPRSEEAVRGLAAYRGAQAGLMFAEAFECVFRRIDTDSKE